MTFQARVLYNFVAKANSKQLSIYQGEIVTVTSSGLGKGWCKGSNSGGETGIFPESYIEVIEVRFKYGFELIVNFGRFCSRSGIFQADSKFTETCPFTEFICSLMSKRSTIIS